MKPKLSGTLLLSGATFIIGILILFSGIKGTIEVSIASRDYEITEGYLYDYEIYSEGGYDAVKKTYINDTYRLIYHYYINGKEYEISSDMGVGIVPEMGSIREVRYHPKNPEDAFLSGPGGNTFKIFFGLFFSVISSFFLWIFLPEKKNKKKKTTSMDGFGVVVSLVFLFFSYGSVYFISGEFSISGIVKFYKTSFILPMIVPLLMMVTGGYLLIKSLFFPQKDAVDAHEKGKNKTIYILPGIFIMVLFAGFYLAGNKEYESSKVTTNRMDGRGTETVDFTIVHTLLSEKDFETANIPTTYWFYDESKLSNVVSGIKGETAFEFYEYTDGETTDEVYNRILNDISPDVEQSEREEHETKLQNGGELFTLTENGRVSIVMYQENVVIYAHSLEGENEIQDILVELGYADT